MIQFVATALLIIRDCVAVVVSATAMPINRFGQIIVRLAIGSFGIGAALEYCLIKSGFYQFETRLASKRMMLAQKLLDGTAASPQQK